MLTLWRTTKATKATSTYLTPSCSCTTRSYALWSWYNTSPSGVTCCLLLLLLLLPLLLCAATALLMSVGVLREPLMADM
jgi:hypothetical protein